MPFGCFVYGVKLVKIVAYKTAYTVFNGKFYILVGFVVSVEKYLFHREACLRGRIELSGRNDVNAHIFLFSYAVYLFKAKGFARVKRHGAGRKVLGYRLYIYTHFFPYFVLVDKIKGSGVFLSQLDGVLPGEGEMASFVYSNVAADHDEGSFTVKFK